MVESLQKYIPAINRTAAAQTSTSRWLYDERDREKKLTPEDRVLVPLP